jgi:sortase B
MNTGLRKTIIVICTIVLLCSLAGLGYYFYRQYLEDQVDEQVSGLVTETSSPAPTATPEATAAPAATPAPEVLEKYADLYAQNPDTIGWLKIEGTPIDYVVMQTPDEPDKYLHLDFYGNYSNRGTLYMDEACDIWNSENLIIYGHHMKSSAMFGDLDYFSSESYWEEHKYIQFDTIYKEQTYEIVAAFYTRLLYKSEEGFRYYQFIEADSEDEFNEYVDFIDANQCYDTGVDIGYGDRLLTLSTCAYQVENGRFAVVAKLVTDDGDAAPASGGSEEEAPAAAAPVAQSASVEIGEEEMPLAAAPSEQAQGFSTDMILLALSLVISGTAVLAACWKQRKQ